MKSKKVKKVRVKICRFCETVYATKYDYCPRCGWPQYDMDTWEIEEE